MTFEQMKIFLEAAHFGSFTLAAERLGLTQSAVSVSIKKLEERHGVTLFDRSGRRLVLTEAGQVLMSEAERILRDVDLTIRRVESRRSAEERYPIVACTPNAYDFWMPELMARIGGDQSMPQVDLLRGTADEVTAWVMRGTADVGISEAMPSHPQFRQLGIFSDTIILCASPARAERVPANLDWSGLARNGPVIWEQSDLTPVILAAMASHRVDLRAMAEPRLRLTSSMGVASALRSGRFLGLVPHRAVAPLIETSALVRVGRLEVPLRYWMFALREREIEPFASLVARAAGEATGRRTAARP